MINITELLNTLPEREIVMVTMADGTEHTITVRSIFA